MAGGPLEYIVIGFEGNHFTGEIGAALRDVVDKQIIRVIDIVFARRDADGSLSILELEDLEEEAAQVFNPVVSDVTSLFSDDDIRGISEGLEPNSSAAIMLFEHLWANDLRDALVRANGHLLDGGLIPREAMEAVLQEKAGAA
jgi:uncharacterized membrane protein